MNETAVVTQTKEESPIPPRLSNGKWYVSEDIREHLGQFTPERLEGLARAIEEDSIRKRCLEESRVALSHHKLLLQRLQLTSGQLQSLLNFTDSFRLELRIKSGCGVTVEITEPPF